MEKPPEISHEDALRNDIIAAIRTIFDPEIPVNIYDMGLIYGVDLTPTDDGYLADVRMTLTSPNCPAAQELPLQVKAMTETIEGVKEANVAIVWDPPWTRAMMSEEATLTLGFF